MWEVTEERESGVERRKGENDMKRVLKDGIFIY